MQVIPALKKTVQTSVAGMRLTVHPTVFHPKYFRTSAFMAKYVATLDLKGKRVLDLGTGTGILGIIAAQHGAEVTAIDINELSLDAARENAERHGVTMRILKSDWFSALHGETFDFIFCNPPYIKGSGTHPYDAAWYAGEQNEHVLDLIEGCDDHLAAGGSLLLVLSNHADVEWWIRELGTEGLAGEIAARKAYMNEELMIFRFSA